MNHIKNIWKCFEEKHAAFCKMALSDILFCYIQYGRDSIPVSCIYIFTRDFGNWSGWYRIYVAKGFNESVWSKILHGACWGIMYCVMQRGIY